MTARLTAWILAFCIGLPMCWCCAETAPAAKAEAAPTHHSCCAKRQARDSDGHPTAPAGAGHCPCLNHEDSRDTPDAAVAVPAPALKWLPLTAFAETAVISVPCPSLFVQQANRHDRGPPGVPRPLYARHCALLL